MTQFCEQAIYTVKWTLPDTYKGGDEDYKSDIDPYKGGDEGCMTEIVNIANKFSDK